MMIFDDLQLRFKPCFLDICDEMTTQIVVAQLFFLLPFPKDNDFLQSLPNGYSLTPNV